MISFLLLSLLLFAVAALLLAAELIVPSHGLFALCSMLAAVGGIACAFATSRTAGLLAAVSAVIAAPLVFAFAVKYYPQTPVGKRVLLGQPSEKATQAFSKQTDDLARLTGKAGMALTLLRPAGSVEIDGRKVDCVSESTVIEPGTPVEVVQVQGLKVIVRPRDSAG